MKTVLGAALVALAATCAALELCNRPPKTFSKDFPLFDPTRALTDYSSALSVLGASCHAYAHATCCTREQTDVVLRLLIAFERGGISAQCRHATERLKCLVCHPDVGTKARLPVACEAQCEAWLHACHSDFFAPAPVGAARMPLPCSEHAVVCSRAGDMFATGAAFCDAMGVRWSSADEDCLDGLAPALGRRADKYKEPRRKSSHESLVESALRFLNLEHMYPALVQLRVFPGDGAEWIPLVVLATVCTLVLAFKFLAKPSSSDDWGGAGRRLNAD